MEIVRAGEWWEYKLVPILSAFYATAVMLRVPLVSIWLTAIVILLAMVPGAAYVSVINDLTDRDEDLAAGKKNRTIGKSRAFIALLIVVTTGTGAVFSWLWRKDTLLLSCYLAAWLAFSLYSLPPFRFKTRGILGVLCDASGAHLFPTVVAVILTFRAAHRFDARWLIAVAVWSFAYGLRGILWHQLSDRDADRSAGVRTFAQRHAPRVAERLGTWIAFPCELLAFATMLWLLRSMTPVLFFAVYLFLSARRMRGWKMTPVVVAPKPRYFIVLHEYYDVFFPLALLVEAAVRHRWDAIVLAAHLLLFPGRTFAALEDLLKLRPRPRFHQR
jgi:4-hydroxybenzoate polyprenyltransferase